MRTCSPRKILDRSWEGGEGGVAEGDDREMGKGRTGMKYLSIWMLVSECGRKGERGVGY